MSGKGAGANIGQGGYTDRTVTNVKDGAGIKQFDGPSPASITVALGGTAKFTCNAEPMASTAPVGLTFSSSAWLYPNILSAGTATIWLPLPPPPTRSPSSWPAGASSSPGDTLKLSPVAADDVGPGGVGYYRCAVMATELAGDPNSSILYVGRQMAELRLPGAGTTPIPTLNRTALALLALTLAGLAGGLGVARRRG